MPLSKAEGFYLKEGVRRREEGVRRREEEWHTLIVDVLYILHIGDERILFSIPIIKNVSYSYM